MLNNTNIDKFLKPKDTILDTVYQENKSTVQCEPLNNYNIIGKYNVSGVGQQLLLGTCPTHQQKIEKILKKSNKDKLDFDAVI
jgi:hypothetical protein